MYTGNIIIVEKDTNPNSVTYGTTRERVEASNLCSQWQCDMQLVGSVQGVDTIYDTYEDKAIYSPTKGQQITIARGDTTPQYLTMYSKCEQLRYYDDFYANSGYIIETQINANPNSVTYKQVRENVRTLDNASCPPPSQTPIIELLTHCKLVNYPASGKKGTNGKKIVEEWDINPYSTTYMEMLSSSEVDSDECARPDTTDRIKVVCQFCEVDSQGKNTGYHVIKQIHTNLFSPDYNDHINIIRGIDKVLCPKPLTNILRGTGNPNTAMEMSIPTSTTINVNARGNWSASIEDEITTLYDFITNGKTNLVSIDFTDVDMSGLMYMHRAFYDCQNLTSVNFDGCDLSSVITMNAMFFRTRGLTNIDMSKCNIQSLNSCSYMFERSRIETANLSGWNTANLTTTQGMFYYCGNLVSVDLSGWDLSGVSAANMSDMFANCTSLTTIYARGCNATTLMKLAAVKPQQANIVTT